MRKRLMLVATGGLIAAMMFLLGNRLLPVEGQMKAGAGFAVFPGEKGGQDTFGPYMPAQNWPKPISALPGNEKWTWGAGESDFCGKPESRFHPAARRVAEFDAAEANQASAARSEH